MNTVNDINTYLSFMIDSEYFAVNVGKVLEVLLTQKITRVPNVDADIKGVINFRGEIIPVFETRSRFALPNRNTNDKFVIIVLEIQKSGVSKIIGTIVDKVKDVISFDKKEIMAVPKMNSKIKEELISGIFKLSDDFIMLLDIDKMFSEKEFETITEAILETGA